MEFRKTTNGLALATTLVLSPAAFAQDESAVKGELQWVFSGGLTFGGDDFATVEYEGGGSDDLEAGGLFYIGGGINYRFADSPVSLQGGIAYHFDEADADNGNASFDRMEFDFIGFYNFGQHRIGLGVTQHNSIDLSLKVDGERYDADFDNAVGFIVEYDYIVSPNTAIGIRYTDIDYDYDYSYNTLGLAWTGFGYFPYPVNIEGSATADASNVGLFIHFMF